MALLVLGDARPDRLNHDSLLVGGWRPTIWRDAAGPREAPLFADDLGDAIRQFNELKRAGWQATQWAHPTHGTTTLVDGAWKTEHGQGQLWSMPVVADNDPKYNADAHDGKIIEVPTSTCALYMPHTLLAVVGLIKDDGNMDVVPHDDVAEILSIQFGQATGSASGFVTEPEFRVERSDLRPVPESKSVALDLFSSVRHPVSYARVRVRLARKVRWYGNIMGSLLV